MRFVRLSVEDFRAIRRLDVEFGAGINVLHGPNDLGKSTVGEAIRAALLVPPNGAAADTFGSWFSGASPRVELTLVDGEDGWWKVKKTFGSSSASSAELFYSKDGLTFALDCRAREVEERLRTLLAWGIPVPGGKGGPRGIPDSFIAHALLGRQDEADDILKQSLATDAVDSGKLRLTKALASLAQDPQFKGVLLRAQTEVDQFFTTTGQRKRGQGSRFTQASERVRAIADDLGQRKVQLETSSTIETELTELRQRHAQAQADLNDANTALQASKKRYARGIEREALVQREVEAKKRIEEIDAQKTRLAAMEQDIARAKIDVDARTADLDAATAAVEKKEAERRVADEAVRVATGGEAVRRQELKKAQLQKLAAELASQRVASESSRTTVKLAIEAREAVRAAALVEAKTVTELDRAISERERTREKEHEGAVELETARALVAFARWRAAVALRDDCTKAQESARQAQVDASTKEEEASRIERELAKAEKKIAVRANTLPASEQLQKLQELERELERAEAALSGGISVVVRPRRPIDLVVRLDDGQPSKVRLMDGRTFAADRSLDVSIDEVAELEITAGSADGRNAVQALRQRWGKEATPLLERAGEANVAALAAATEALQRERLAAADARRSAQQLRAEAKSLREQAELHLERAGASPIGEEEVAERQAVIGAHDLSQLEARYEALKRPPEARVEQLLKDFAKAQSVLQEQRVKAEEQARLLEFALNQARDRSAEASETYRLRMVSVAPQDLDAHDAGLDEQLHAIRDEQERVALQLGSLHLEVDRELEQAKQMLDKANVAHNEAKERVNQTRAALDETRERLSGLEGAIGQFRPSVELLDRSAAEAAWQAARSTLASIPVESISGSDDVFQAEAHVATAHRQHAAVREELIACEGALSQVGGAALKEEVERLEEARLIAESQQRALEIDADAWKLLRDTLRAVENDEGAHLGRALAGPVGTRFSELTGGRYRELRLDAALRAEGLDVVGAPAAQTVLGALSVGTRSQLAALIRLTIADQLRSAIVLDDHLVHTDVSRFAWFHEFLRKVAVNAQVVVITCRPQDYLAGLDVPAEYPSIDLAGGTLRAIDLGRLLQRHAAPATM